MMMPDTLAYDEHGTLLSWTQPALLPAPRPHRTLAQRIAGHQDALARLQHRARVEARAKVALDHLRAIQHRARVEARG